MINNGTILGVASVKRTLILTSCVLSVLFTIMEPKSTEYLTTTQRFLFWVLHIGVGIIALFTASRLLLLFSFNNAPVSLSIIVIGILGAFVAAPLFLTLELLFPTEQENDWLSRYAQTSIIHAIVAELIEVLPIFFSCWIALNIPIILNKPELSNEPLEPNVDLDTFDPDQKQREKQRDAFFASLPEVIGTDIIAICSDLHYLNVHTTLGKALILGSVSKCTDFMGESGLLIHRSNWVAKKHVERIVVSGNNAYCCMNTGLKVAISRSKRKDVKRIFGQASQTNRVINIVKNNQESSTSN